MSAPLILNTRILQVESAPGVNPVVFVGLSHFGTDSRLVVRAELHLDTPHGKGRWGTVPVEVSGTPFSYFGQFIDAAAINQPRFSLAGRPELSDYNFKRLNALSEAVAYLLNEFHGERTLKPELSMEDIHQHLDDKTFLLSPAKDESNPLGTCVFLLPLNLSQSDLSIAFAKIHPAFNNQVPAHYLFGLNAEGVLPDLLAAASARDATSRDKS